MGGVGWERLLANCCWIPWTGMGYTYDWGALNYPFGASEFILVPGAEYEIVRIVKTMDYFQESDR